MTFQDPLDRLPTGSLDTWDGAVRVAGALPQAIGAVLGDSLTTSPAHQRAIREALLKHLKTVVDTLERNPATAPGVVSSKSAARRGRLGRQQAFVSGILHALAKVVRTYGMDGRPRPSSRSDDATACVAIGHLLTSFAIVDAWSIVGQVKWDAARLASPYERDYMDGVEFALKGVTSSFQSSLEGRISELLAADETTAEDRRLITLLFIAGTGATIDRIRSTLGNEYGAVAQRLGRAHLVQWSTIDPDAPRQLTADGVTTIRRLLAPAA